MFSKAGKFKYVCTVPTHETLGMWGKLTVTQVPQAPSFARGPALPAPARGVFGTLQVSPPAAE